MQVELNFHFPSGQVETFKVNKNLIIVGRGRECDALLSIEGFSRRHCQIEVEENGNIYVTDLNSTNGVLIEGERIPAGERTLYQTFLNLQIGSASQVTVEVQSPESPVSNTIDRPTRNTESVQKKEKMVSEHTRTIHIKMPPNKSVQKQKEKEKKEQLKSKALMYLIILSVAAVAWFQYERNKAPPVVETKTTLEEVKATEPIKTEFVSPIMVEGSLGKQSCEGAKLDKWCKDLSLRKDFREGVIINESSLMVYINVDEIQKTLQADGPFFQLPVKDQMEILLMRKIIETPALSNLRQENTITNLQLIAVQNEKSVYMIKINKDYDAKVFKRGILYMIIDEGINQGKTENLSLIQKNYEARNL